MKSIKLPLVILSLCISLICSCGKKSESHTEEAFDWPEMDAFHTVMADSFHPYIDSGNLEPAFALADEMADLAKQWAGAKLPEKVDNDEVRMKLKQLQVATDEFRTLVASDDEQEIGEYLTDLHDLFHDIQEHWYAGEGGHEHHHDHHH